MLTLNRVTLAFGVAFLLTACGTTYTVKPPTLQPAALQEMQTREFEAGVTTVFASLLTILQDGGYIVEQADRETGFLTAKSTTDSGMSYNLFWGFQKESGETRLTATIQPVGEDYTRVRLNFVLIEMESGIYGDARVDTPVEDQEIYSNVFAKLDEAIFVQQAIE